MITCAEQIGSIGTRSTQNSKVLIRRIKSLPPNVRQNSVTRTPDQMKHYVKLSK